MNSDISPSIRTYGFPGGMGAVARYELGQKEYIDVESDHTDGEISVNWTTGMNALEIVQIVHEQLPPSTDVDIWRTFSSSVLSLGDMKSITENMLGEDGIIRVSFEVKETDVAYSGLFLAWRIIGDRLAPPYHLGVTDISKELTFTRNLVAQTATHSVLGESGIIDELLNLTKK